MNNSKTCKTIKILNNIKAWQIKRLFVNKFNKLHDHNMFIHLNQYLKQKDLINQKDL